MADETTKPARRTIDLRTFDQLLADVAQLRQRGYDTVGQWSLEQVLEHLTQTMLSGLGLPRPVRWLLRPVLWRLLSSRQMPRMPAPASLRPPNVPDPQIFGRFGAMVEQAANLTAPAIDHPAFGRMRTTDWQQLQLIHASRHLSFLLPRPA